MVASNWLTIETSSWTHNILQICCSFTQCTHFCNAINCVSVTCCVKWAATFYLGHPILSLGVLLLNTSMNAKTEVIARTYTSLMTYSSVQTLIDNHLFVMFTGGSKEEVPTPCLSKRTLELKVTPHPYLSHQWGKLKQLYTNKILLSSPCQFYTKSCNSIN